MQDYPTLRGSSGKSNSNKGTAGAITMLHNWLLVVTVSDGEVSKVFLVHHTAAAYKSSDRNTAGCSVTHVWSTAGICYELSCGCQNRSSPPTAHMFHAAAMTKWIPNTKQLQYRDTSGSTTELIKYFCVGEKWKRTLHFLHVLGYFHCKITRSAPHNDSYWNRKYGCSPDLRNGFSNYPVVDNNLIPQDDCSLL